ncbi:hypothetical protein, partial [Streptomyces sp. CRB46]|uniref:hypothetical protein n=1 Tax=Streptomyces sp. CRB46 TaxID=2682613 RepID=UPI001F33DF36
MRREPVGSRFSVGLLGAPRGLPRLPIGALGPARTTGRSVQRRTGRTAGHVVPRTRARSVRL